MKKRLKLLLLAIPISLLVVSCYPEFDATVSELDLAITKYDDEQNFPDLSSFYLYDTIVYITEDDELFSNDVDHTQGPHILAQVRENLTNLGWTEVTDTVGGNDADVSILISALEVDVSYYYNYWWNYWNWYPWGSWYPWYPSYPGYPGYPWYPSYPSYPTYGYTVGTVLIDMINMDEVVQPSPFSDTPSIKIPIVWTGAVNGILTGTDEYIETRLTKQIGQVFEQSTYLHK